MPFFFFFLFPFSFTFLSLAGCIVSGSELCQYKQKKEGFENQQWGLSVEGYIHAKTHKDVVLAISSSKSTDAKVYLANKKTPDHEEQRWNFVLPVFKQKSSKSKHVVRLNSVNSQLPCSHCYRDHCAKVCRLPSLCSVPQRLVLYSLLHWRIFCGCSSCAYCWEQLVACGSLQDQQARLAASALDVLERRFDQLCYTTSHGCSQWW